MQFEAKRIWLWTYFVSIPIFNHSILPNRPEVVTALLESHLHHRIVMCKDRSVAVAEFHSPNLDVLVGGAGDDEL